MLRPTALLKIAFAVFVCAFTSQPLYSQTENPSDKPLKVKQERNDALKRWINEDASIIATKAEIDAFRRLKTNEERENFINYFWLIRDTNPDTEENEYREEFYERIEYANEHFTSGIPGWRTDRGRVYILRGKPDSIESHPTGGSYDRPSYEGGGSTTTYPFEIWFYRHLDGVGDGLEIEFVDPSGTGEYRLARDADEKDALKNIPGAGLKSAELLGIEPKTNRGLSNASYQREQDTMFRRMEIQKDLLNPPSPKFGDLLSSIASSTSGAILDKDPVEFDLRIDFFRQSDDRVITAFTIQTSNRELRFKDVGGLEQATMNILGRITAVSGKRFGIFEDSVTTTATSAELAEARDRKSIYQKAVALQPGDYKVDVAVRDVETGNRGIVNLGFKVPRYDTNKLSASSLVLASKLRETDARDIGSPFVIGSTKVLPNMSGIFKQGQDVGLYMQVYNAGVDQTTLRPSVDVDYILTKDGKEISKLREDWSGLSDSGQRLTLARLLPTAGLMLGDYELKVLVKDRVGGQVIENKGKFTITQ